MLDAVAGRSWLGSRGDPVRLGVAEGVFAAGLAASLDPTRGPWCRPAATRAASSCRGRWTVLGTLDLAELCRPSGRATLGALGALPAGDVLARFGSAGARCSGWPGGWRASCPGRRAPASWPAGCAALRSGCRCATSSLASGEGPGRATSGRPRRSPSSSASSAPRRWWWRWRRAARCRRPGPVRHLVRPDAPPANHSVRGAPPWPGRLPPPSPSRVASAGRAARVGGGRRRGRRCRGQRTGASHRSTGPGLGGRRGVDRGHRVERAPCRPRSGGGSGAARRSVRLQVTTADGKAHLLEVGAREWRIAATYD